MGSSRFASLTINLFAFLKAVLIFVVMISLTIVLMGVPLPVSGHSMEPNFHDHQIVLVKRLGQSTPINRGDVVAAAFPADPSHTKLIKRVIGLPGEAVIFDNLGHVTVNGRQLVENYGPIYGNLASETVNNVILKSGEYFLMGDNRPGSSDSRIWGAVQQSDIQGKVKFVIWPFNEAQYVDMPRY